MRTIVTYDTHHGAAKRAAEIVAKRLGAKLVDVDTPFAVEDPSKYERLVMVFGFRGPYTAQLTKLFLSRMGDKLANTDVVLLGVGLFSEKEFPVVADQIRKATPFRSFEKYFVRGQLRVAELSPEEQELLGEFSRLTGMEIKDMGEFDAEAAARVADEIAERFENLAETEAEAPAEAPVAEEAAAPQKSWVCQVCGYVHYGDEPPANCPMCGVPAELFAEA